MLVLGRLISREAVDDCCLPMGKGMLWCFVSVLWMPCLPVPVLGSISEKIFFGFHSKTDREHVGKRHSFLLR